MNLRLILAAASPLLLGVACSDRSPVAYGPSNSLIVAVPDTLWSTVQEDVRAMLEPRIFAVRDERTFELTQISPQVPEWSQLRHWKQVLVIGQADDPWVAPVIEGQDGKLPPAPTLVEATGTWAQGQRVTALVLPPDGGKAEILETLPELYESLDTRYKQYARTRMFASGPDEALRTRLAREAGFSLLLPEVYKERARGSTYVFRNHYRPKDLGRTVLVTWRPGVQQTLDADAVLDWRENIAREFYDPVQLTGRDQIESGPLAGVGARAFEVRGIWSNSPEEWPAAGPFISRIVVCPEQDRTFLLDAWLYAPAMDKYEYIVQLETILDSFECSSSGGRA